MRSIDGEELMDRVSFILSRVKSPEIVSAFQKLKGYLENAPVLTLDDLRPKGRWSIVEIDKASNRITIECPECGMVEEMSLTAYGLGHNFCHSCGADMRGGGEDG